MTAERKSERLIDLVMLLLATRRPLDADEIRAKIPGYGEQSDEAFHRMFERDKADLRDLGLPVEQEEPLTGPSGYRIPARDALLDDPGLTPDEQASLSLAAQAWESGTGPSDAALALLKLSAVSGEAAPGAREWLLPRVALDEQAGVLLDAVLRRKRVTFTYRGGSGEARERTIEPTGLVHRGGWYVTGIDSDAAEPRHFKLSRIEGGLTVSAGEAPDFEPHAPALDGPRAPWEGDALEARLAFAPDQAWIVERRPAARRVDERPDGWVEIALPIADVESFASWVAGFGPDAVALEPPALRDAVMGHLRPLAGGAT